MNEFAIVVFGLGMLCAGAVWLGCYVFELKAALRLHQQVNRMLNERIDQLNADQAKTSPTSPDQQHSP